MSFFLSQIYYALEAPGDGAVALAHQWQRKEEDFPAYRVPSVEGGLLSTAPQKKDSELRAISRLFSLSQEEDPIAF